MFIQDCWRHIENGNHFISPLEILAAGINLECYLQNDSEIVCIPNESIFMHITVSQICISSQICLEPLDLCSLDNVQIAILISKCKKRKLMTNDHKRVKIPKCKKRKLMTNDQKKRKKSTKEHKKSKKKHKKSKKKHKKSTKEHKKKSKRKDKPSYILIE